MASTQGIKRKAEDIIVDPDTLQQLEDSKRPKIELDSDKKFKCLNSIVSAYVKLVEAAFHTSIETTKAPQMQVNDAAIDNLSEYYNNITVGNHITSIIFTLHNINRQKVKNGETNMIKKTASTSFKIHYRGNDYLIQNKNAEDIWIEALRKNGLEYRDFDMNEKEKWYGTMGPYIDMFSAYALRVNELRLGHNNMPISKINGVHKSFPVSKYGLSGAHHVLLEGTSFPPERRSSIVQSLGPMTAWLCMIRSEGIYRNKYAAAVKRAMSHIPCIDDIIALAKNTKQAYEISALTTLVAEILLITTSRQATRMFFPLSLFAYVWRTEADPKEFCRFFSTTGAGGWYTYKKITQSKETFTICGEYESEMISQVTFHGIFGTFKEDLSILSQISSISTWFTREQMGSIFRQQGTSPSVTKINLPSLRYYSKMSCANQTGLLSGVYNQVATVPCFSGARIHRFDESFFEHIEKKRIMNASGKTLTQIINILTSTLEELHSTLRKNNGRIEMGTTKWFDMETLRLGEPGEAKTTVLEGTGKMFLGRQQ